LSTTFAHSATRCRRCSNFGSGRYRRAAAFAGLMYAVEGDLDTGYRIMKPISRTALYTAGLRMEDAENRLMPLTVS
jgi:hypothetical protein